MIVKCNKTDKCTEEHNGKRCPHYGNHEYDRNNFCDVVQADDTGGCVKGARCVLVDQEKINGKWVATWQKVKKKEQEK